MLWEVFSLCNLNSQVAAKLAMLTTDHLDNEMEEWSELPLLLYWQYLLYRNACEKKTRKIPLKDPTMPNQHPNDDTHVIRPQYHGTNMLQHSIFIRWDNYVISDIYRIPPVPYSFLLDDLVTRAFYANWVKLAQVNCGLLACCA